MDPWKVEDTLTAARPRSGWVCHLFGATDSDGISWEPEAGRVPNAFWRLAQFLVFGNRWVQRPPQE